MNSTGMTKHDNPCLLKAADNEPLFVLRAKDILAPIVVEWWAKMAAAAGVSEEKAEDAMRVAATMREWPGRKLPG